MGGYMSYTYYSEIIFLAISFAILPFTTSPFTLPYGQRILAKYEK